MRETWVRSLGCEDPLEKGKATHSSILAWRIPWTIQSTGSQRVRHNWATFTFTIRDWNAKVGSQENTWSNRQIWPWNAEWSRAKANRVLPREHTHSKHPLPTTQEKTLHMDITRWSTPKSDWLYSLQPKMEKLYTVSKTRPGADCGSDHELLIAKFRLKLKKLGKTTRPFDIAIGHDKS